MRHIITINYCIIFWFITFILSVYVFIDDQRYRYEMGKLQSNCLEGRLKISEQSL